MVALLLFSRKAQCLQLLALSWLRELVEAFQRYSFVISSAKTQICQLSLELASSFSDLPKDSNVDLDVISILEVIFKNQACLNASFLKETEEHTPCTSKNHGVDIAIAENAFEYIRKVENESIKNLVSRRNRKILFACKIVWRETKTSLFFSLFRFGSQLPRIWYRV